ncbi:hypothetical protein E4U40_002838 [Claviceps sp. LM458 group G5]|nr:hypothetical protein E4U40_002838 [Claviceps sp. LM458 group G5]KAG6048690.1 hypothetical protein E4U39_007109 [Claviceps sp. Clav50 group G5]
MAYRLQSVFLGQELGVDIPIYAMKRGRELEAPVEGTHSTYLREPSSAAAS